MSLQHSYRPQKLEEFFGGAEAMKILKNIFVRKISAIPKAFLIIGPTGCGKTTLAYIIRDLLGVTKQGFFEYDASTDRGIDNIRKIKRDCELLPMTGKRTLIFFDEVHGVTPQAQEAMLKMIEEPPAHVNFVLATTELAKIKDTLLRRCTQVNLQPLKRSETVELLTQIAQAEEKTQFSDRLFHTIHKLSFGSPGISVKLFDEVMDMENDDEAISSLTNLTYDQKTIFDVYRLLISDTLTPQTKWEKIRKVLASYDGNEESSRLALLSMMNKQLLKTGNPRIASLMELFLESFYYTGKAGLSLACFYACAPPKDKKTT